MQVRVHVSLRAAVLAGKTKTGLQTMQITEEDLAQLADPLRLQLAIALEDGPELGTIPSDPHIVEPTLEGIRPVLEQRAATREAQDKQRRIEEARAQEEARVAQHHSVAKDAVRAKALRKWIEEHGDEDQRARMREGFLRDDEVLESVMDELISINVQRHVLIRAHDACECACAVDVKFTTGAPQYMDSHQFARLTEIRDNAPEGATVEPVEHKAQCPSCRCLPSVRITARVSLPWHGWLLVRDFSLH